MAIQSMSTSAPRIGKLKGEILKHAVPVLCLGMSGDQKKMPKNGSDTVIYRRWLPKGAAATNATTINTWSVDPNSHLVQEGVTPDAETMAPQDVTVQLQEYAVLYSYSNKVAELYEDKIPDEMKTQTGERMGLLREMIDYGTLKSCTNKFYSGGSSRAAVDEAISLNLLRKVTRSIKGNRGKEVTKVLSASADYGTAPVERGYIVFTSTDSENDVRNLPNFVTCAEYGQRQTLHDAEIGSCENFRFIVSPELGPITGAGATVGSSGLEDTGGNVDIYPFIVVAADAWANVALRGMESFDVIHIPHDKADKNDPLSQRGYIGARMYSASFIQNDGHMAVIEAGVTAL
jgi:N4-gp56 family major capsid protein